MAFDGTTSRIAGITLKELTNETLSIHTKAYPEIDLKKLEFLGFVQFRNNGCLLYTSPSPRDLARSRMPSSA